ncbi:hypothetical protein EOA32_09840 [Mesorhizobium sp. M1A.F.Ca.ET.072.01.1.1]|uniref:sarcosine oxidase subunit gamma n=1 Tax=Mesorhizobium sp. M1A.F.Ca.ET.072.01.1.1 TaxID=2496753 RepID=UPI000FD2FEE5|nr:hypothetical protein [Mesorhizobium sp. M1A.F.Ca.ET.072.01.1.1]RUW53312.1 hypothetical protein EOA32_09840 [Mesorhizobium sp. M1A.F.Ca.ET.072.01.1.1]TIV04026.1 MAG: hypothetical protein E5W04_05620 [Mesorhizobium sp.]
MAKKHPSPIRGTTTDGLAVTITETELGHLTQLAGWEGFDRTADQALRTQGLPLPSDFRSSVRRGPATLWRTAPDRVLIRSETPLRRVETAVNLAILDLSDSRVCLTLEGPGASGLLSRVAALDFGDAAFLVGQFAQTAIHQVSVLIDRQGIDQFTLLIPTTFAMALTSFLADHLTAELVSKPMNR